MMVYELAAEIGALREEVAALRKLLWKLERSPQNNPAQDQLTALINDLKHTMEWIRQSPALRRSNHHEIIEIDLTRARNQKLVWNALEAWKGFPAVSLSVFAVPSAFSYAVNAVGNGFIDASKGDVIENEDVYAIYVTNAAATGTGKLRVSGWLPPKRAQTEKEKP